MTLRWLRTKAFSAQPCESNLAKQLNLRVTCSPWLLCMQKVSLEAACWVARFTSNQTHWGANVDSESAAQKGAVNRHPHSYCWTGARRRPQHAG